MHPQGSEYFQERFIICKNRAAVAVTTKGLCRKKARGRNVRKGAGFPALIRPAKALGGVFYDKEPVFFRNPVDGVIIRGKPENINGDYAAEF